jgi:hypothetical protein
MRLVWTFSFALGCYYVGWLPCLSLYAYGGAAVIPYREENVRL